MYIGLVVMDHERRREGSPLPTLGRLFGKSRVLRAVLSIADDAMRESVRSEMSAEAIYAAKEDMVVDAISFRYVDARPWGEAAALLGFSDASEKSMRALCEQGFECIDFLGWANVVGGAGDAS